jgi:hypothetical protein
MSDVPIKNTGQTMMFVAGKAIPPGETLLFAPGELPPHLKPAPAMAAAPVQPADAILALLDQKVSDVVAAIKERDEQGNPVLTDDQVLRMKQAEENGKTRKSLMKALDEEWLARAEAKQAAEDLAVFTESLKDMPADQLKQMAETYKEDPDKLRAVEAALAALEPQS